MVRAACTPLNLRGCRWLVATKSEQEVRRTGGLSFACSVTRQRFGGRRVAALTAGVGSIHEPARTKHWLVYRSDPAVTSACGAGRPAESNTETSLLFF